MKKVCDCEKCGKSLYYYPETLDSPEESEVFLTDDDRCLCDECFGHVLKWEAEYIDDLAEGAMYA